MAAPTSYTETALKTFMVTELSRTGAALGLTAISSEIGQAVTAVERLLGILDVATATDMTLVEAAARWCAWLAAESASANDKNLKAGTSSINLSERFEHIQARLERTEAAWYAALATSQIAGAASFFGFATVSGCRGR